MMALGELVARSLNVINSKSVFSEELMQAPVT
jgi:hypothetical protein